MRRVLQIVLPIVFLAASFAVFAVMRSAAGTARSADEVPTPLSVEVVTVHTETHTAFVEATGTVQPATRVDLVPQVAGRIVSIAPGLTPGAVFAKGDVIARIDARDYQANVIQAESNVTAAALEVSLEEGRVRQASREAELLGRPAESALARREPQLEAAQARLASAEAVLTTARLALERTALVAPFDAIVTAESLDVGQYVAPGAPVATLIGSDRFRVRVSVPVEDLAWIDLPDADGAGGSTALVSQQLGNGSTLTREGFVLRLLGELDPETRTAALLVAIDRPLDVPQGQLPILPGAYVGVRIAGRAVPDTYRVPRTALVDGASVWVADEENLLASRPIDVQWGDREHVYVTGPEDGDRVVITTLSLPIVGMPLDVRDAVAEAH